MPLLRLLRPAALALFLLLPLAAAADSIEVREAELRQEDDAYVLNATFEFAFNPVLEEALVRGVPLYFLLEFELARPRWYWFDEKLATQETSFRVSYNPLTRQYRLSTGLLSLNLASLEEVRRALSRVRGRPVLDPGVAVKGERYEAAVRLKLDVTRLPKPFQLNALTAREWTLQSEWYRWVFAP